MKDKNPFEGKKVIFIENSEDKENADGKRGHLQAVGDSEDKESFYGRFVKRLIDIVVSAIGLIVLSPVFLIISLKIVIEDPGPVFFSQKRIGKNKKYFKLHKFRSMKTCTPHDTPTHMLENPEQYITKTGKFIRSHSLDELPQIWDILVGNMSIIGPRPALWNQDVLIAERDKYGANDVKPGLTGWAQINGRDELEIEEKARLDGEYVQKESFLFDAKCFFGTISKVGYDDSIVEGKSESEKDPKDCSDIKVSIIVATYRREVNLKNALESLANQTHKAIQVIVVDDNANEEWNNKVEQIINGYSSRLELLYIKNETNKGSAATRNIGIEAATGQYITFLDDDDIYCPDKIANQLLDMVSTGADFSIADLGLFDENDHLIEIRDRKYIVSTANEDLIRYHLMYHMTGTDTLMFKREYLKQIGGFPGIDIGDEFYLMLSAIKNNGRFCYSKNCDVKAYVHTGENEGLSSGQKKIDGENALFEEKKKYFNYLTKSQIKYVRMRHFAVIAFAELRRKQMKAVLTNGLKAFCASPIGLIKMFVNRK